MDIAEKNMIRIFLSTTKKSDKGDENGD